MTFVDDGPTDEVGRRREPYQPDRYPKRWAPILVYWQIAGAQADVEVLGGGFPTRIGDVYVTGLLFLNADSINDPVTRTTLPGGFENDDGLGTVGPAGVTWGRVMLHELAHMMGLGHVRDPGELMYPELADHMVRPAGYAAGDAIGLRHLGAAGGCAVTPPPGTPRDTRVPFG